MVPIINPFLAFQHGTVHVGNKLASVCDIFTNIHNASTNVPYIFTDAPNVYTDVPNVFTNVGNS